MTTQELANYYANLLILQYVGLPRAYANIQAVVKPALMPQTTTEDINFSLAPTSGTFKLGYDGELTSTLNWDDSAATIETALQALTGLGAISVTGSIPSQMLSVTFTGVPVIAFLLTVDSNTLVSSGDDVEITVVETDVSLPLTVQDSFNLIGSSPAVGAQLDTLGKYAGITRYGYGLNGTPITLDDSDFLAFIIMTIIKNSSGSSLATIQDFLHIYFAGAILVFDYKDMRMSYFLNSNIGSQQLAQMFVTSKTLPVPMGVQVGTIIYTPNITTLFGFRTYPLPGFNITPFNDYTDYQMDWPWLTYRDALNP